MPLDIAITLTGIVAIIAAFVSLHWVVNRFSAKVLAVTWFRQHPQNVTNLQQNTSVILLVVCAALCLLVAGVNGALIYQDRNIATFYLTLLSNIPRQFWTQLAIASLKCMGLLLFVKLMLPSLLKLLDWGCVQVQDSDQIKANDQSIQVFFNSLKKVTATGAWLLAIIVCGEFMQVPAIALRYLRIALRAYLAISLGRLIIKATSVLIDTLDALSLRYSNRGNILRHYERIRHLVSALKKALEYILYVAIGTLVIQDIDFIAWVTAYVDEIIKIIGLYFLCSLFIELGNVLLEDFLLKSDNLTDLQRQRRLTLIPLFKSILRYFTYFVGGIIVLHLMGLNPAPILAGAGIVGLAVGFGAQNLINDVVSGFFILFENYYLVGDYIEAGKVEERVVEGQVEAIELRTTHIRHPEGQLQIIRNGEIGAVINYSKQYAYARVDVPVPDGFTLEQVYHLIQEVGHQLQAEYTEILEPTQIEGLEAFDPIKCVVRTMTRVTPGKHLLVQRILRSKVKVAFEQARLSLQ